MQKAIQEAQKAYQKDFVPVGAVIVYKNKIIAKAHNKNFWHAEVICIDKALKKIPHLADCTLYSTIEPCPMCEYAIKLAKIETVIYGYKNSRTLHHELNLINIENLKCKELIQNFFKNKRK